MDTSKCNTTFCPPAETNNNLASIFFLLPWLTASIKTISLCEGWESQQIIAVVCLLSEKCFHCFSVITDIIKKCPWTVWPGCLTLHWMQQDAELFLCWTPHPQNQTETKAETQLCQEALSCSGMRPFPRIASGQSDMSTVVNNFQPHDTNTSTCYLQRPVLGESIILTYWSLNEQL